jgi:hypothetical protein
MEVLLKHMSERLVPPTQVNPRIPKGLGQVIERLMAKDPDNRYRDADELVKDLEQVLHGGKPKAVAAMEGVIQRMEELAKAEGTPVRSRTPITAAVVSGIVAAMCAVLFTVALPEVTVSSPKWEPRADPFIAEASEVFKSADEFARKNPGEIEEIRNSFRKIIKNYEDVEPYPTKARTRLRECERQYDSLCEQEAKKFREDAARHSHNRDLVPAILELYEIPRKWLLGSVGREVERERERIISELRETTGMTLVPGGAFKAGRECREEEVDPFLIQIAEVSNADYAEFVRATKHAAPAHWPEGRPPSGEESFPVVGVTYADAQAYAVYKGLRLPTALEWEMAARGTDGRIYPWGDTFDQNAANCHGLSGGLRPVTEFSRGRSPYGCLNMAGNAHEWTSTPTEGGLSRIVRGGAYRSHITNVRTFSEIDAPVDLADPALAVGFRCVKDVR